jgi:hypothetical protein
MRSESTGEPLAFVVAVALGVALLLFLFVLAVVMDGEDEDDSDDAAGGDRGWRAGLRRLFWPPAIAASLRDPDALRGRELVKSVLGEVLGLLGVVGVILLVLEGGGVLAWIELAILVPAALVAWRVLVLVWLVATGRLERPPPATG